MAEVLLNHLISLSPISESFDSVPGTHYILQRKLFSCDVQVD